MIRVNKPSIMRWLVKKEQNTFRCILAGQLETTMLYIRREKREKLSNSHNKMLMMVSLFC